MLIISKHSPKTGASGTLRACCFSLWTQCLNRGPDTEKRVISLHTEVVRWHLHVQIILVTCISYHIEWVCVIQEVQSLLINWKGPDLTTYGELVLEGTFKVHRAKNERTLFLFDRMLLITKRRGEHYVYKTHISVRDARGPDVGDVWRDVVANLCPSVLHMLWIFWFSVS